MSFANEKLSSLEKNSFYLCFTVLTNRLQTGVDTIEVNGFFVLSLVVIRLGCVTVRELWTTLLKLSLN